jgi:hypothetical protein
VGGGSVHLEVYHAECCVSATFLPLAAWDHPFAAVQTWSNTLALGQPFPTLPLWLTGQLAMPVDLEQSYEQACHELRIT